MIDTNILELIKKTFLLYTYVFEQKLRNLVLKKFPVQVFINLLINCLYFSLLYSQKDLIDCLVSPIFACYL